MSTKYNEEAEDLMFELFDEDDFTKVIMIGSEERVYGVEKDNIQSDLNKYVSQQIAILIK